MKKIEIFEEAMCCSTGVCGPSIDTTLLRISSVVSQLSRFGVDICRYNLSDDPQAFLVNTSINQIIQETGVDDLPITVVDQTVLKKGEYPTDEELQQWTGIALSTQDTCCDCDDSENDVCDCSADNESPCDCEDTAEDQKDCCCEENGCCS